MMNRIQKLLFSEYSELEELILIESPFAETERSGTAIRQIQLGLSPKYLIIAQDMIPSADEVEIHYCLGLDPEIETLELISVIPVECVNLSVFNRRKRHTLKAHFCNSVVKYYELGGTEHHSMFWNLWCEKVRFLSPSEDFSCVAETSAESSSTESSLYIKSNKLTVSESGKHRLWCHYGKCNANEKNVTVQREQSVLCNNLVAELLPVSRSVLRGSSLTEIRVNFEESLRQPHSHLFQKLYPEDLSDSAQKLDEEVLQLWERNKATRKRHFRRYGFCAHPSFLNGFANTHLGKNEFYSVQLKPAVSAPSLSAFRDENEFQLPVSKSSLTLSVSLDGLSPGPRFLDTCHNRSRIFFWTPGFWYCPVTFHKMYQMLREHLQRVILFLCKRGERVKRSLHSRKKRTRYVNEKFGMNYYICDGATLRYLKRKLKMKVKLSVWNFTSTVLAYQLTMIDRDMFCKVEEIEIEIILKQHSARNTPNIAAIIAFSHRISCLVATDILEQENEKARSLLIIRFINVAEKCNALQNFQSCHSVLEGLQSPSIHRLRKAWDGVRKEYPSKYCLFEKLCRKHRDPRLPAYQKAVYQASLKPPFLPFIGDILARALERVPNFPLNFLSQSSQENIKNYSAPGIQDVAAFGTKKADSEEPAQTTSRYIHCIRQFLSFFHIISVASMNSILDKRNSEVSQSVLRSYSLYGVNSRQPQDVETCCFLANNGSEAQLKNFNSGNKLALPHPNYGVLKVGGGTHLLDWYQRGAMVYDFTIDKLARDYLLKAHYQEEKQNYLLSMKIESTAKDCQ